MPVAAEADNNDVQDTPRVGAGHRKSVSVNDTVKVGNSWLCQLVCSERKHIEEVMVMLI